MEFLIINENKLKIMLTKEDVKAYGIESEKSDYRDPKIRKAFWQILDRAKAECGFSVSGEKLLIQYYPASFGGEIFVNKLGKISGVSARSISESDSIAMLSSRNMIYRFLNADDLYRLCSLVGGSGVECEADVYLSEDGGFYLFFEERGDYGAISRFSLVSEFAEEIPHNMENYIKEHSEIFLSADAFRFPERLLGRD